MLENFFSPDTLQRVFLGNTLEDFIVAGGAFLVLLLVFKLLQAILFYRFKKLAEKTATAADDVFIEILRSIRPPFYSYLSFYLAMSFLELPGAFRKVINVILVVWAVYQVTLALQILIDYLLHGRLKDAAAASNREALKVLGKVLKGILWTIGVLFILSNVGIDVTSFIAGLGIGGVAVALALQNILSDLFSSFAIFFDKPFEVGDFVVVGENLGVVERIGIKTTRLRALQGEEIVISNRELTSVRIQNFKKMKERRVAFSFGVTYDTPIEKLKEIPQIIKEIITAEELARFSRAHFNKFDDSALNFEVVYYVQTADYDKYMDINQDIHLKVKEAFDKRKISMAFPTRTIYLEREN